MDEIRISGATKSKRIADEKGIRVWIFTVPARELGLAYERHNDVLYAGNKAFKSVKPTVDSAVSRSRSKIRQYYRDHLSSWQVSSVPANETPKQQ